MGIIPEYLLDLIPNYHFIIIHFIPDYSMITLLVCRNILYKLTWPAVHWPTVYGTDPGLGCYWTGMN